MILLCVFIFLGRIRIDETSNEEIAVAEPIFGSGWLNYIDGLFFLLPFASASQADTACSDADVHIDVWNRHRSNMRDEHLEDGAPAELKTLWKAYVIDAFNSAQSLESAPTGVEEIANSAAVGGESIADDD
jgi:hypothetical protein